MKIAYKNIALERTIVSFNFVVGSIVGATFALLYGFDEPLLSAHALHLVQICAFFTLLAEKIFRFFNARSKKEFFKAYWFEAPLLILLILAMVSAGKLDEPIKARLAAIMIYLVLQVVDKLCRTCVNLAASGKNPTQTFIGSFIVLILCGSAMLMLPKSHNVDSMSFVDALFTSTSASCVTGLITLDTGADFSRMGQWTILFLIQLGGLGIVIFGAVFALLLGQALSLRESVAMNDIISNQTLGKIGKMIGFIFTTTILIEAIGAFLLYFMWDSGPEIIPRDKVFYSIFHSISAFCNAGFSLYSSSLMSFGSHWGVFLVVCPLIILGGLGFMVLFNISDVFVNRLNLSIHRMRYPYKPFLKNTPRRLSLQTKIVLVTSLGLIIGGTLVFLIFENNCNIHSYSQDNPSGFQKTLDSLFMSITCRTAGFNTVDVGALSEPSKLFAIVLMLIGGSPGSTAGGMKTVTIAIIVVTAIATLKKRTEVEAFQRSINPLILRRAMTIMLLFMLVYFIATMGLFITERTNTEMSPTNLMFEAASALGTVGLSTGITPTLTSPGKLIIIVLMLIGRLGPMTLLASLTFNTKNARYNYPSEPVIVG